MQMSRGSLCRRRFLARAGALATSAALPKVLFAQTGGAARLVVVVLRGALDGLAAVPSSSRSPIASPVVTNGVSLVISDA